MMIIVMICFFFPGLYRCRLGDVVEVAGFHNGTPKLNFVCRRKLILTVNIDKNTEKDLQLVVERGSHILNKASRAELIDFTSYADVSNQPGHYVIYWEIKGEVEDNVLGACCNEMDKSFADHGYVVSRKTNSIGPLELCVLESGTFKKILDNFIANGAALSQFKTPRCTNNHVLLKILNTCTTKKFRSTAYNSSMEQWLICHTMNEWMVISFRYSFKILLWLFFFQYGIWYDLIRAWLEIRYKIKCEVKVILSTEYNFYLLNLY